MRVSEIMTADPACCTPNTRLSAVARLMIDNDCGEIPVVEHEENRRLMGVITDRDIVIRGVANDRSSDTPVAEIMTSSVISIREDADMEECCNMMEKHQVRRIPVLDGKGRLTGIVAQADIALNTGMADTAEVVKDISKPAH